MRVFLTIAVEHYLNFRSLSCARHDAKMLRRVFQRELGFDKVLALTESDLGCNKKGLSVGLKTYLNNLQLVSGDQLVVYVAGHGMSDADGHSVLLMHDAEEADLEHPNPRTSLRIVDELLDLTRRRRGVRCGAIIDACRVASMMPHPVRDSVLATRLPVTAPGDRHPPLEGGQAEGETIAVLYACEPNKVAFEITGGRDRGSVFALSFRDAVRARRSTQRPVRLDPELIDEVEAIIHRRKRSLSAKQAPEQNRCTPVQRPVLFPPNPADPPVLWAPGRKQRARWLLAGLGGILFAGVWLTPQLQRWLSQRTPDPIPEPALPIPQPERLPPIQPALPRTPAHTEPQPIQTKDATEPGRRADANTANAPASPPSTPKATEPGPPSPSSQGEPLALGIRQAPRLATCPAGQTPQGEKCRGTARRLSLREALAHARTTQGFRLPTQSEMAELEFCFESLAAPGTRRTSRSSETGACSIAARFANGAPPGNYWTLSMSEDYPQYPIAYSTEYGTLAYYHPAEMFYVILIQDR